MSRDLLSETHTIRALPLLLALALWMLLVGAGCALVFRWTAHPPEAQPYSAPLRTRPPQPAHEL